MKKIENSKYTLYRADNYKILKTMSDNSIDSIVCDPPYGLSKEPNPEKLLSDWLTKGYYKHQAKSGFMNQEWDAFVPQPIIWKEALRVLKPGGYLIAFFSTRTYDLGTLALRLAGFEIKDQLAWIYATGFPKNQDVSKALIKLGNNKKAKKYQGWGTALKPAQEPICLARKPLSEKTVAKNIIKWGTGALNIDTSRIPLVNGKKQATAGKKIVDKNKKGWGIGATYLSEGRYPANIIHDGSKSVVQLFPISNSARIGNKNNPRRGGKAETGPAWGMADGRETLDYRDSGSASRFFYCAKVSRSERNLGLESIDKNITESNSNSIGLKKNINTSKNGKIINPNLITKNNHPTVKPMALMTYLCKLVTPRNGIILDPFMGSGSTGISAINEKFYFIGIEIDKEYFKIAKERIQKNIDIQSKI